MKNFGVNEKGNLKDFELICRHCTSAACDIIPEHIYKDGDFKNPIKITLTLHCRHCGNEFSCDIHYSC